MTRQYVPTSRTRAAPAPKAGCDRAHDRRLRTAPAPGEIVCGML